MAIYPTLFVFYLRQMSPWFGSGSHAVIAGLFVVVTCASGMADAWWALRHYGCSFSFGTVCGDCRDGAL